MLRNESSTKEKNKISRIPWIDFQRGIAILLMIPANFAPLLSEPHALWFRILVSFAAPMFIMLSNGMVVLNKTKHDLSYFLLRGGMIISFAILIDIFLNHRCPFTCFDVLYIIGLGLPSVYLTRRISVQNLIYIGISFFIVTYVLHCVFGYSSLTLDIKCNEISLHTLPRILKGWFIDSWFPIFPWLGYAFWGAAFFQMIFKTEHQKISNRLLILSIIAAISGFILLFLPVSWLGNLTNHTILEGREGYSEIFYPPTLPYMIASIGIVPLVSWISQQLSALKFSHVICTFGQYSLLIYILHQCIEFYIIAPILDLFGRDMLSGFWFFNLLIIPTIIFLYIICIIINHLKQYFRPTTLALKMLFGK